jgi:Domain of unknown function (DUF3854)
VSELPRNSNPGRQSPMQPSSLYPQHFQELVTGSGIDSKLVSLNFLSLEGNEPYEYLLISDRIPRTNTGQVSNGWLRRYAQMTLGGWWCAGLDPLNHWQGMEWGCYKPNHPRQNAEGKPIKYEHPPATPTRIFCLRVPLHIWQQTATRYQIAMPKNIVMKENGEAVGFWRWVVEEKLPIIICEGAKKAAALLSCGYAAIALPGINSGYRVARDWRGRVVSRQLIPDLTVFSQSGRTFYLCFDYEIQPKKKRAVDNAIAQLGHLLEENNCPVKVIRLPGLEKGVDDFIVAQSAAAFQAVYQASVDLETDLAKTKPHTELTYLPALTLDQRYLGKIPFPQSGLIGIKSAKGTGKTTALETLVQQAKTRNQPILLITHRIQLGRFLSEKIGVNWLNSLSKTHYPSLGLCIDSIWKLHPLHWQGAIVILDEVEQSLWHLLNSETCKDKRVKILKIFQQLIATVLQTGGLVIAQDADLSDLSLDYLKGLAGIKIEPWVVVNEWKPETGWDITFYDSPNPTLLIHQLEKDLIAGKKCYVTTDTRSGRYSPETIDRYIKQHLDQFQKQYPKTLVVSSQTTSTPGHEAGNFIEAINTKAKEYDAVFVTPSLGTGISIDVEHFDRVYGIFQGVIPDSEARQALARIRPNIPRIVWCTKRGIGLIGSGSKNYKVLAYWYQQNQTENLALMSPLHKIDVDLPLVVDLLHLRTWAKFAARVNASITLYRQSMVQGLIGEGHLVNVMGEATSKQRITKLRQAILTAGSENRELARKLVLEIFQIQKQLEKNSQTATHVQTKIGKIRDIIGLEDAESVVNSDGITLLEYEALLAKRSLTTQERHQVNKYILKQRYGIEVTPQLKQRDERGYYSQLLTHYYLTHEREYFQFKDRQEWNQQLARGEGKVFLPDLKTYTLKIEALRALAIPDFLDPDREFRETDSDLIHLKEKAIRCSKHIKRAIGISLPQETEADLIDASQILGRLLNLLGLKLKRMQHKVYQLDLATFNDGREEIFAYWRSQDEIILESVYLDRLYNPESERWIALDEPHEKTDKVVLV